MLLGIIGVVVLLIVGVIIGVRLVSDHESSSPGTLGNPKKGLRPPGLPK